MEFMDPYIGYYATILIVIGFIAFFGWETAERIVTYVELTIRYQVIKCQLFLMRKKLEKQLGVPSKNWSNKDV